MLLRLRWMAVFFMCWAVVRRIIFRAAHGGKKISFAVKTDHDIACVPD